MSADEQKMSNEMTYFSIHNILNFAIINNVGFFNRAFDNINIHYENFKVEGGLKDYDLVIEIGKFNPNIKNKYVVGNRKYYIGKESLYVHKESYKGAKWRFEVKGINSKKTIVKVDCNPLGRIFITGNVVDFILHLKLLLKGYPIIHASAISKNGKAIAFCARGGGSKTTLALEMVSKGFDFLGDNYVIIHEGKVFSFLTSLSIFTYNLMSVVSEHLNFKERCAMALGDIIFKGTKGYAKFFTKINPKRVIRNITQSSELRIIFLLVPSTNISGNQVSIEMIDRNEAVKRIVYNQMLEFLFFNKYIQEYSFFFPESKFSQHWSIYEQNLIKNLNKDILIYKVELPQKYNKGVLNKILENVLGVV